mmetsp:Transcript_67427/g.171189  ORF Transcript_67427/g.171189 Transcript_67427/m.171189 type:complete len:84 (+) Transcript_67427:42-293(+)
MWCALLCETWQASLSRRATDGKIEPPMATHPDHLPLPPLPSPPPADAADDAATSAASAAVIDHRNPREETAGNIAKRQGPKVT